jgi:hypothetical protein
MQLSPFPCHLIPLRSKYFPQHPILNVSTTVFLHVYTLVPDKEHLGLKYVPVMRIRTFLTVQNTFSGCIDLIYCVNGTQLDVLWKIFEKFLRGKNNTNRKIMQQRECVKRKSASRKKRERERESKTKQNKTKQNKILSCGAASFGCSGHFKMFLKTVFSIHIHRLSP